MTDHRPDAHRPDPATLLQACRDAGAAEVEVLIEDVQSRGVFRDGTGRGRRPPAFRWTCVVRVLDERGALGVLRTDGRLKDGPAGIARRAMELARLASAQADLGPPLRLDLPGRGLGILDPRLAALEDTDRNEVVDDNSASIRGLYEGITPLSVAYEEERIERSYKSTNGVVGTETSSLFTLKVRLRDSIAGTELVDHIESRHFADVASVPLGIELARRLFSYRRKGELPGPGRAVLVDPVAVARLLPALVPAFSAERIEAGTSFLRGRQGERIGSPRLHLIDDPGLTGALRTRAFDDRGVPPMAVPLLREGLMGSTYLGTTLARGRRQRPTGHERHDGSVWPGNLIVRAGTRSRNMLLPELGPHLAIADVTDLAGVDLVAGTLDLPVMALVMDGPEAVGCAGPRRLRCSIPELLGAVVDVCSDQERIRDVDACTWICEGLTLT